jgi:hypothetical protein
MLVTPFDKTDAYKLGIIDAKGKLLKRSNQLRTVEERNAYTLLHRLVFRLKRIIEKVPIENKKFLSFAAALALIRENYEKGIEPINLESMFLESLKKEHDTTLVENFFNHKYSMTFKQYLDEEDGGAPANNAAVTGGIAGLPPDEPPVPKMNKLNMFRRKRKNEFMGKI